MIRTYQDKLERRRKKSTDSLRKRYASKLVSRLVSLALGFITVGIVPRTLGPTHYGNFSFLTFFFLRVDKFLNMGTSSAFYTKLSNRLEEKKLIGFYGYFVVLLFLLVCVGIVGVFLLGMESVVWPEQKTIFIWAAALFAILSFLTSIIHQINDAYGFTVKNEIVFLLQSVLSTALILTLYFVGYLTFSTYFLLHYVLLVFIIVAGWWILHVNKVHIFSCWKLEKEEVRGYAREFFQYSHPLIAYSLVMFLIDVGDRWFLQKFSGSTEQGYYSLAFKIGTICFLFTSSMSTLFLREFSICYGKGDKEGMRGLFSKYIPLFYFIAAYFAIFISFNSEFLSTMIGGNEYKDAAMAVAVLALYPIHQTYGQLSGSVFLATGQTKLFRNISVTMAVIGICASYVLMAPGEWWGVGLGAFGLGLKMITIQFIVANIQLWFNARYLQLSFSSYLGHQLAVVILLFLVAWVSKYLIADFPINNIAKFIITGTVYTIMVVGFLWVFPGLIAMTRNEIKVYLYSIKHRFSQLLRI